MRKNITYIRIWHSTGKRDYYKIDIFFYGNRVIAHFFLKKITKKIILNLKQKYTLKYKKRKTFFFVRPTLEQLSRTERWRRR